MITIVLVDDQAPVRHMLRMRLESEPDLRIVGEAADGQAGIELVQELRPDVVLMDVVMPHLDGIAAASALCALAPETAVVILTLHGDAATRAQALAAGAVALIEKGQGDPQLLDAIRRAARSSQNDDRSERD